WVRIGRKKPDEGRQDARGAEAALEAVVFMEGLLQGMQLVGRGRDALDGENIMAVRLHREHQAGARRAIVEEDGACPANAVLAAEMGAGEAELVTDEISQCHADLDFFFVALAVDGQGDLSLLSPSPHRPPGRGPRAGHRPRRPGPSPPPRRESTAAKSWR